MDREKLWDDFAAEIRELDAALGTQRGAQRRSSRGLAVFSATALLTILLFILVNYLTLSSSWAKEKLAAGFQQEFAELGPAALDHVHQLGSELLPLYAREGRRQLAELAPAITAELAQQVDLAQGELLAASHRQLEASKARILALLCREIFGREVGSLADEEEKRLLERFQLVSQKALAEAVTTIEQRFSRDLEAVRNALLRLDISDTAESPADLQKKFLRLWLQALDQELEEL